MKTPAADDAAIMAAMAVLDAHIAALNARDEAALVATLHFPHYRLTGGRMKVWERPGSYLEDFYARGEGLAPQRVGLSQRDRRRTRQDPFQRPVHALPGRQLGYRFLSVAVDRLEARRPLGRPGALQLRGVGQTNHSRERSQPDRLPEVQLRAHGCGFRAGVAIGLAVYFWKM